MKKPWSMATALRNPERLRGFLIVLRQLENSEWTVENQKKYHILSIQSREYGFGSKQFYKGLSQDQIDLIEDPLKEISYEQAEKIFNVKNYEDPPMRGRQSINPFKKLGFAAIKDNKVLITDLGRLFLQEDFDFGEIFFRGFLKWQIPHLGSREYPGNENDDIKPFVGTLHLINTVNKKELTHGNKAKGISKKEFSLFALTLVNYRRIEEYADKIIHLRAESQGKSEKDKGAIFDAYEKQFAKDFLDTSNENKVGNLLKNLKDYGDNAIRYFRLTSYIYIRGGGFYIDLEPRRSIEIDSLLKFDNAKSELFDSEEEYFSYISDISKPQLPWETKEKYIKIIEKIIDEIETYNIDLKEAIEIQELGGMQSGELKNYIAELRAYRKTLQSELEHKESQKLEQIEEYIRNLKNIGDPKVKVKGSPILLEKFSTLGLRALNDAVRIQPNYPVGDDNEPTFTAPANTPDIECFYDSFNAICEVTMLNGRNQWYNEGQPVMRHLRDFENKYSGKTAYCLFIAPTPHRDTLNTFWNAIKYEYEGTKQKIVPLAINDFVSILKILVQIKSENKFLKHSELSRLYDEILNSATSCKNASEWAQGIPSAISSWQATINFKI